MTARDTLPWEGQTMARDTFPIKPSDPAPTGTLEAKRQTIPLLVAQHIYTEYTAVYGHARSLEDIKRAGGFGWNEMLSIMIAAADLKERQANPSKEELTTQAREAFEEITGTRPNTSRERTGGAW